MITRVFSTKTPPAYFYHTQPRDPSKTLIRFCAKPNETDSGWQYCEYTVEVPTRPDMDEYIRNHYMELRAEAMGGASIIEQLCAAVDYLSMMSGISIPTERGAENE